MSQALRVLQVVTQMNRGGMENRLMDIYRNLDRDRVQFDFYTLRSAPGQFDEEIRSLGGKIYYGKPLSAPRFFEIPGRFEAFFRLHPEYTVCHAHLNQWCNLILEGARRAGVPMRIAHARTALSGRGTAVRVKNFIARRARRAPTHRFAVSEKAARWLYGDAAFEKGLCEVWPNAIDSKKFLYDPALRAKTRAALSLTDEYTVLHVGNLRRVKNHDFLFRVFEQIEQREKNSVLLLAGQGEREGELKELARTLGLSDKIRFLLSRDDIPALLSAADVFVFPSFYEGLPGAVLEAQAADLPCFISDTIAHEVVLSERVRPMSIDASAKTWADAVLLTRTRAREDAYDLFCRTGYDVAALAQRLLEFYTEM
ncbi:MAG: glycosyltransferase [Clostridia bacterium]|nr:glycosyltransferase [Clostridia bacterium]